MYFRYGQREIDHLGSRDKRLGEMIHRIGPIRRTMEPNIFQSVVFSIVGQQITSAARDTLFSRLLARFDRITPERIAGCTPDELRPLGLSQRKAESIVEFAEKVDRGGLDLTRFPQMTDEEVIAELTTLRGIGRWTAEMLLIFSLERPDVLSFGDGGIQRGLCRLHRHRRLTRELFEKYRHRYSPFGSVASLYLWAIAAFE